MKVGDKIFSVQSEYKTETTENYFPQEKRFRI